LPKFMLLKQTKGSWFFTKHSDIKWDNSWLWWYSTRPLNRVTRLGEILPFGLLFIGPGKSLGTNMVCF
jgi:hypothetical protein